MAAVLVPHGFSQLTDAEKRELFLRSREGIRPVPRASATPRPKPTPAPRATPRSTPRPAPTPRDDPPEPAETPRPTATPRATPTPRPTPTPKSIPAPEPTPEPKTEPTPEPQKTERPDAPIVVEKSGKAKDEGLAPPPKKPKKLFGLFGSAGPKYRYLNASVRGAIDSAKVKKGRWKYIIVHNSGTRQGNAKAFDNYHKKVRKMPNGLAYHFVIGNGTSSGDGEIEIGNRWVRQINGGHVASDYLNNIGLGICFVGDFNRDVPTKAQLAALEELIRYLRRRCGKVSGKDIIVRGHKQINPKPTDCPGDRFPLKWLGSEFGN